MNLCALISEKKTKQQPRLLSVFIHRCVFAAHLIMTNGNFPLCRNCTVPVLSLVSVWYRVIALCFCTGETNICVLLHVTAGHQSKYWHAAFLQTTAVLKLYSSFFATSLLAPWLENVLMSHQKYLVLLPLTRLENIQVFPQKCCFLTLIWKEISQHVFKTILFCCH